MRINNYKLFLEAKKTKSVRDVFSYAPEGIKSLSFPEINLDTYISRIEDDEYGVFHHFLISSDKTYSANQIKANQSISISNLKSDYKYGIEFRVGKIYTNKKWELDQERADFLEYLYSSLNEEFSDKWEIKRLGREATESVFMFYKEDVPLKKLNEELLNDFASMLRESEIKFKLNNSLNFDANSVSTNGLLLATYTLKNLDEFHDEDLIENILSDLGERHHFKCGVEYDRKCVIVTIYPKYSLIN